MTRDTSSLSSKRIRTSIKADILFQLKHGFYYVYIVLSVTYIGILYLLPREYALYALPVLLYIDPSALGLFFIGGMMLLEKEQGLLSLIYITPLRVSEYVISKVLTLGIISTLSGVIIALAFGVLSANFILLIVGIMLTSIFYTLIGFTFVPKVKSVNEYLVKMIPLMMVLFAPCLLVIPNDIIPTWVNYIVDIIPSVAGLRLVMASIGSISILECTICIVSLLAANILLLKKVVYLLENKVITNS